MKLESVGIIIALRPFGERDMVAHIFTRDYGVLCGMMRGAAVARKNRPLVGQLGAAAWNARLDSNLGVFHWESSQNLAAPLMADARGLSYINSTFALLSALLPEREKYPRLYGATAELFEKLAEYCPAGKRHYLDWEICLLQELGYALDLSRCSNCGAAGNLTHLSPRTGRAVCAPCAAPYAGRLFNLPVDLDTTKYFIGQIIAGQGGRELPPARKLLAKS